MTILAIDTNFEWKEPKMDKRQQVINAFNEWMRRYTEDPAAFEAEFQTVAKFQSELKGGIPPSYGETSVAYLEQLMAEQALAV